MALWHSKMLVMCWVIWTLSHSPGVLIVSWPGFGDRVGGRFGFRCHVGAPFRERVAPCARSSSWSESGARWAQKYEGW